MGNAVATLGIQVNEGQVYSGGCISGKVFLQVNQECDADTLQVEFTGMERSHVHWTTTRTTGSGDNRKTETVHHHAYASRCLVSLDVPLAQFPNGKVSPGNYEFPFSAVIPPGLPTSMAASGGGGDCSVRYQLKARLHRPGMFKWDVKTTRSLIVQSAPLPPEPVPFFAPPETVPVKFCCCFDRGCIHLGVGVDDTLLGRGQSVGLGVAIQNESSQHLDSVSVTIQEVVRWHARGHSNMSSRTIAMTEFDLSSLEGLDEMSKGTLKAVQEKAANDSGHRTQVLNALATSLLSGKQRTTLTVSADARDTYSGNVLHSHHICYVTSKTPCCVTDPTLEIPVRIGTLPLPQPVVVAQPIAVAQPIPVTLPVPPPLVMAEAIPIGKDERGALTSLPADWSNVVVAEAIALPMGGAVIGGASQDQDEKEGDSGDDDDDDAPAAPAATMLKEPGSMEALKELMDRSLDDLSMLKDLLATPESAAAWTPLFGSLEPSSFGKLIGEVNLQFDQPGVAELLGKQLSGGVTAQHIVAAIKHAAPNQPPTIVKKLVPLCNDLSANVDAIEAGLSEWEKIMTKQVLHPSA